ncbi:MAG: hypothetical protein ACP59X_11015 [Solidesulfovibrio sp. DCME]|uniref:hypothetical protein n=1 Tax=Solidesulfovibrio sp. DCME TaxID=3447380 RepID=UPI003D152869
MQYNHIEGVIVTAEFTEEHGERYRHWFEVQFEVNTRPHLTACVIMMNPIYACAKFANKSVQFINRVVFQKDFPKFQGVSRLIIEGFAKIIRATELTHSNGHECSFLNTNVF